MFCMVPSAGHEGVFWSCMRELLTESGVDLLQGVSTETGAVFYGAMKAVSSFADPGSLHTLLLVYREVIL